MSDPTAEQVDQLPIRARHAARLRFGLVDGRKRSWAEVGSEMNVTAESARRLVKRALESG